MTARRPYIGVSGIRERGEAEAAVHFHRQAWNEIDADPPTIS